MIRSSFVSNCPRILILRTEIKSLFWCIVFCIDKLNLARLEQTELFDPIKKIGMNSFSLKEELKEESLKMCNAIQLKKSPIFADELVSSPGMTYMIYHICTTQYAYKYYLFQNFTQYNYTC